MPLCPLCPAVVKDKPTLPYRSLSVWELPAAA
jgi:hypothetical protein